MRIAEYLEKSAPFALALMWVCLLGVPALWLIVQMPPFNRMNSSDIASWVQAIGSIAAIIGALAVNRSQMSAQNALSLKEMQHQIAMKKESETMRAEAFLAVLDYAAQLAGAICVTSKPEGLELLKGGWLSHTRAVCQASLASLKSLPVHELGSYELVMAHSTMTAAFFQFIAEIDLIVDGNRNPKVPESHPLLAVLMQNKIIQEGFNEFEKAHEMRYGPFD